MMLLTAHVKDIEKKNQITGWTNAMKNNESLGCDADAWVYSW